MTQYTVVWLRSVHDEVAEIWLAATDRNAVTDATTRIDKELAFDAEKKGKPLAEGLRFYDEPPLRAIYAVDEPDRIVEVSRIRLR